MADEEIVVVGGAASPAPADHKRKLEDLEPEAPERAEPDGVPAAEVGDSPANDESEAKRPRVEEQDDDLATENGYQKEKEDEVVQENVEEPTLENDAQSQEAPNVTEEAPEALNDEQPSTDKEQKGDAQEPSIENPHLDNTQQPAEEEFEKPTEEILQQEVGDAPSAEAQQQPASDGQTMSQKMEVPNNKVGVLIGKAGDTIRFLQYNSGAKIQITRDADADPYCASRPVELIGTLENINKAEKLIRDVIAEADAGGSPSLVARGFAAAQAVGVSEQVQIQVPNEKVGLIIGKGGETIKSLQTRSGARIQVLIPQHLPEGDQSKERTVRVTGDKKQIEMAREMIKEVMNQPVRSSNYPASYNTQGYRPRGPTGQSQWGPRGPHPGQPTGYDYQRGGPYPSQNQQYPPPSYGGYPQQQMAPRGGSYGSGWGEQRPPANMQGQPQSGGYDFYGGHGPDGPGAAPHSGSMSLHAAGPSPGSGMVPPPSQGNYNYGQPQGPDYGQQAQYSQTGHPQQGYGSYDEPKYDGQAPTHPPYGGHGSQPVYQQGGAQSGYPPQQSYGKPQSYGMPSQVPAAAQSYGPPRPTQPGEVPYQGSMSSNQSYGPNAPQQQYPYASTGPMQQTYPTYGAQPVAADGYNQQQPPASAGQGYPQQGGQPMSGYGQPGGGQQVSGYAQVGSTQGGYGQYPSQPGYAEQQQQQGPNNAAAYGYQGPADPSYNSVPAYGPQPGYVQPTPAQAGYDQSMAAQSGGYGAAPVAAPVGYGKSLSPQPGYPPQYDATQMYGAHR